MVIGELSSGRAAYDVLLDTRQSSNYSAFVNHSLSVLKHDRETVVSNRKQVSSFGCWYSIPYEDLCLVCLTDMDFGDGAALAFLKALSDALSEGFPELVKNGNSDFDRASLEQTVKELSSSHSGGKLGRAKAQIEETAGHMKKNISTILDHQNDLEAMDQKTDDLRNSADLFSQRGRELERKMRWRNKMMLLLMGGGAFCFILVLAFLLF